MSAIISWPKTVVIALCAVLTAFGHITANSAELFIDQVGGVGNYANVHQTGLLLGSEGSYADVNGEVARGLSAWIWQVGDLQVMLARQIGQQNYVGSIDAEQSGVGNFASVIQINSEAYPINSIALPGQNRLGLKQDGATNTAYLVQRGTSNNMLGFQIGDGHDAEVIQGRLVPSNFNQAVFRQRGSGNVVRIHQD